MISDAVGVALFDGEDISAAGWAALPGKEAFRIGSTADLTDSRRQLDSHIVWVTNLDDSALFAAGLGNHIRYRSTNFLHERSDVLLKRLGVPDDDPRKQAEVLSVIVARVLEVSEGVLGIDAVPPRTLQEGLRSALWPNYNIAVSNEVANAITSATIYWQTCERRRMRSPQVRPVTYPHASYGVSMLSSSKVPDGEWTQVSATDLPARGAATTDWVKNEDRPILVRARFTDFDPVVFSVINFGGGLGSAQNRNWISLPELQWLNSYSEAIIDEAYVAKSWMDLPRVGELLDIIGGDADAYNLSVSMSLFIWNAWLALGRSRPRPGPSRATTVNPMAPFLRAWDRYQCFDTAYQLYQSNNMVQGYGMGRFSVSLPGSADICTIVSQIAYPNGLIPPAVGIESGTEQQATTKMPDQPDWLTAAQRLFAAPVNPSGVSGYQRILDAEAVWFA